MSVTKQKCDCYSGIDNYFNVTGMFQTNDYTKIWLIGGSLFILLNALSVDILAFQPDTWPGLAMSILFAAIIIYLGLIIISCATTTQRCPFVGVVMIIILIFTILQYAIRSAGSIYYWGVRPELIS